MIKKTLLFLGLVVLVFGVFFSNKYLALLDSVYFYPEAFKYLISKATIWDSFNHPFGGVNLVTWLYPLTYLIGFIGTKLNLSWNFLVRIFFYIPSVLISFYSVQILAKKLNLKENGRFLLGLIYVFNTYFISLVDGGQLGILLAYAVFPLGVYAIVEPSFYKSSLLLFVLGMLDPRFLALAVVCGLVLAKPKIKLMPIFVAVLITSAYWWIPLVKTGYIGLSTFVSDLRLTSSLNALFLYQPHWPYNEFGKVHYPDIFFVAFPLILVISALFRRSRQKSYWLILFVLFAFLVKGYTDPFGFIYAFLVEKIPFGSAFRDSTKFFVPLILVYGLIVSSFYDTVKNKFIKVLIPVLLLIPLVKGLYYGNNNNLAGVDNPQMFLQLKDQIKSDKFERTLYIPQRAQMAYQSIENQAIDARVMTDYLPFASDNYGSEDRFNFMLRDSYINYFKSLGIRNLVYLTKDDYLVTTIEDTLPEKYYIDKLAVVVGSPIGVEKLVPNYGVLFLEDGTTDISRLLELPKDRLFFVLNAKKLEDLKNSLFKDKFMDLSKNNDSNWAKYGADDYLTWKYQLIIRGIDTKDINYNLGIVFSSQENETFKINYQSMVAGEYKLFVRGMSAADSKGLDINGQTLSFPVSPVFQWKSVDLNLNQGNNEIVFKNLGGFNVVGTVFLVRKDEYTKAIDELTTKLKDYQVLNTQQKMPESSVSTTPKSGWMIWNQSYDERWVYNDKTPFAINSMTNAFYVDEAEQNTDPYFTPQKYLDFGIKVSLASILILVVSYLAYVSSKTRKPI